MKKNIEFAKFEEWIPDLNTIKSKIPQWYKDQDMWNGKDPLNRSYEISKSFKSCIPFLDAMTSGYSIDLWTDIRVRQENNFPIVTWASGPEPVLVREPGSNLSLPIPHGCSSTQFAWRFPYTIQVPAGYSCLITHPLNRNDLPFLTVNGIIDSDRYTLPGLMPFFLKEGFSGLIPKGTPFAQIFPIKREAWISEMVYYSNDEMYDRHMSIVSKFRVKFGGVYKKTTWVKKSYE